MDDLKFLPTNFLNSKIFNTDVIFSRELTENGYWFQGAEDRLEYFFKHEYNTFTTGNAYTILENQTKFWRNVNGKTPRIHSGLPKLATSGMVKLLTSGGIEYSSEKNESDKERLELILKDNKFNILFQKGVAEESWAGFFFYKITHDKAISKYPIIEMVSPKDGEAIFARGRIKGYRFKSRFTPATEYDKCIEIHSIYTFDKAGRVGLVHEAYEVSTKGQETKLDSIPVEYADEFKDVPNLGITFLPGVLKNNTSYNSRFPDSNYGESDYSSIQSLFQDLDNMYSQRALDVNNARAQKFINEKLIPKDEDRLSGGKFDEFQDQIEMLAAEMELDNFDIRKFITILQGELRVDQFTTTIKELKIDILNGMGLDPETLGLVGYLAVNSSAESKAQSQNTSLETRAQKIELWKPTLEELFNKVLMYDDMMNSRTIGEYDIEVNFGQYLNPTMRDKVKTLAEAITGKLMDIETAVEELYGEEKTTEEKAIIVRNIKIENLIALVQENLVEKPIEEQPVPEEPITEES